MAKANEHRGEIDLTLGGKTYVLRPSFQAIAAFEKATGLSLVQLTDAARLGSMSLQGASAVATECINAAAEREMDKIGAERCAELIYEADGGLFIVQKKLAVMLSLAATGGYSASGVRKSGEAAAAK